MVKIESLLEKEFEELTFEEKMVLALKGALEEYKIETDEAKKEFIGMFIGQTSIKLKEKGIEIF